MIKIKELEKHFESSFDELIKDNDICLIADDLESAWEDYKNWEKQYTHYDKDLNLLDENAVDKDLESRKNEFMESVKNNNADDLFNYELNVITRHFMLENGKVYYLNNYI